MSPSNRLGHVLILLALGVLSACSPVSIRRNAIQPTQRPAVRPRVPEPLPYEPPGVRLHFARLGLEDGLSQSSVLSIAQDDQGFMWFGTEDGLNRYDGYNIKIFRPVPGDLESLSDQWINVILEDSQGLIWVGTRQGGLNRFNPLTEKFTRYLNNAEALDSLSSNMVLSIFEDSRGWLWVGTSNGLERFNPEDGTFVHYSGGSEGAPLAFNDSVEAIAEDRNGWLWIGTGNSGLWQLDPTSGSNRSIEYNPGDPNSLSNNHIRDIAIDYDGTLWLGTDGGLNHFNPANGIFRVYRHAASRSSSLVHNHVFALHIDGGGTLWVGTRDGLDRFDREKSEFIHYRNNPNVQTTLSSNTIYSLYEDQGGVLWIGTYGGGLSLYDRFQNKFTHYYYEPNDPNSLGGNFIFPIYVDDQGIVWIGTYGNGLDRFDTENQTFTHIYNASGDFSSLLSNRVWSVLVDHTGTLWVGTDFGLERLNNATGIFTHFLYQDENLVGTTGSTVYVIHEDSQGYLWLGTNNGLARFDPATETFYKYRNRTDDPTSLSDNEVVAMLPAPNGKFWVGTFNGGLNYFDPVTGRSVRYMSDPQNLNSLSNNSVLCLYLDGNGILWIGTAGGGLNRLDPKTGEFQAYRKRDGLASDIVVGILEDDDGYLWLSTNNGLSRFSPHSGTFKNFTASDGLQSNEFNRGSFAKDRQGNLYFGGINGLTVFDPANIVDNPYVPPVALTALTYNGQEFQSEVTLHNLQGFTLRWPNNSFEFELAALSYSKPEENQFAYMLEGADPGWYFSGTDRSGRYVNLPGGDYVLRLKASNSDGFWNDSGIAIPVRVVPPFWDTWSFQVMAGLLLVALLLGGYQIRERSIKANTRELERQVTERTREIAALFEQTKELAVIEERNRLARELHDSAKQKAFAALAQLGTVNGLIERDIKAAKAHLDESENLVYEVIQELTFLIQEIHPVALKEKGLATMLREYAFEWENRNNAVIDLKITGERRLKLEIEQSLYRVTQEALANVARHSGANAVSIRLAYNQDTVEMEIKDNGCGFDMQNSSNGMGLRSIRERVESVVGTFIITSEPKQGTRLSIQIPIDRST